MSPSIKRGKQSTLQQVDEKPEIESEMKKSVKPQSAFLKLKNLVIFVMFFGIIITTINIYELRRMKHEHLSVVTERKTVEEPDERKPLRDKPVVWILGKNMEFGYLQHVVEVFKRLGFETYKGKGKPDVLWAHDYPFSENGPVTPDNESVWVNHFPGCGYFTNKVFLATSNINLKSIPKAFKLPEGKEKLLEHVKENRDKLWVQKNDLHRGVKIVDVQHLDLETNGTFVQEFIQNPLLVDGRKFDIGIYAILTSVNPVRAYINEGEALLRFCEQPYLPFNESNKDSYVIGDNYAPIWTIPSLKDRYKSGLTMKQALNAHLVSKGKNPLKIWIQIREIVAEVYSKSATSMLNVIKRYSSTNVYFEMCRFDFVVDEDLNVFLMEANMSPNLSSLHYPSNKELYEMVVYDFLHLAGIPYSHYSEDDLEMLASDRDTSLLYCGSESCQLSCNGVCRLCVQCLNKIEKKMIKRTIVEHGNRRRCRRILPKPINQSLAESEVLKFTLENLTQDKLLNNWFFGKCLEDSSWCF